MQIIISVWGVTTVTSIKKADFENFQPASESPDSDNLAQGPQGEDSSICTVFDLPAGAARLFEVMKAIQVDISPQVSALIADQSTDRQPAHLLLATPGLGKTRAVQMLIAALPVETVVWVFQPTLQKAREFACDMARSNRFIHVFRGRGAPVEAGANDAMCCRHNLAAKVAAKGLSIKRMLCGLGDTAVVGICHHWSTCHYQAQLRTLKRHEGGGVFVMTHASLTVPPPCPEPHLIIIDEDPSFSLPRSVKVDAHALSAESELADFFNSGSDNDLASNFRAGAGDDGDRASCGTEGSPETIFALLEALVQGLAAPEPLFELAATVDMAELEDALAHLRGLERKLRKSLQPCADDTDMEGSFEATAIPLLRAVQLFLTAVREELRLFTAGVIDRSHFNGLSVEIGNDGRLSAVTAHFLASVGIKASVPMIILDGTADPLLVTRALRRRTRVWRIDVARQGEVIQCTSRGFSNASLAPAPSYPQAPSLLEEREELWRNLTTVLRREAEAASAGILVVSTLAVEEEARRRKCCDDLLGERIDWIHFGATRGLNSFTERQTVVLIGRKQPPAVAVQDLTRAFFANDPAPFDLGILDYVVRRKTLYAKSGHASPTINQIHQDTRVHRVLWQMREAEVIQAIDRVRAVRFPRKILLLNTLDLRRPDDDWDSRCLGVPADAYVSWSELWKGGNRAEAILLSCDGFLPLAPRALAQIAPLTFPRVEAAKKWLYRTDLDRALACHAKYIAKVHVRPARQRGASWPLLVDQRHHPCLIGARASWETKFGIPMAVWICGGYGDAVEVGSVQIRSKSEQ